MADKIYRCAVYTRKSTEDGLEQEFNSLDAQYEACSAYALSQRHEGWIVNPERYDDGGFSGGTMQRPGLKRLLADIEAGLVDVVLLYKIDRLTRSLSDFSRIVEVLDNAKASFVSITQSFNTTTSMGRLTLNMLLSFAQFEREVTGERIRDKIAASKRRGIWMGGTVPLGYRVKDRKLLVVPKEAEQLRHILQRYLVLGTVPALVEELGREGYRTKSQKGASGPHRGGSPYQRGTIYHLLTNRIYRGMIVHKGEAFPGEHEAIVDEQLWDKVQATLKASTAGPSRRRNMDQPSLLAGLITDGEGRPMTPSHSGKSRKTLRYRYYVTRPDFLGGKPAYRVSAADLESIVCVQLAQRLIEPAFMLDLQGAAQPDVAMMKQGAAKADLMAANLRNGSLQDRCNLLQQLLAGVQLGEGSVRLTLDPAGLIKALELNPTAKLNPTALTLSVPAVRIRGGHQLKLVVPGPEQAELAPRHDRKLIALVAEAIEARELVLANPEMSMNALAKREGRCRTRLARLAELSCLAPDIVRTIVEGRQPAGLTAKSLSQTGLSAEWEGQKRLLGFGSL